VPVRGQHACLPPGGDLNQPEDIRVQVPYMLDSNVRKQDSREHNESESAEGQAARWRARAKYEDCGI
jgi:hypothetical protein